MAISVEKRVPHIREFTIRDFKRVLEIRKASLVREFRIFGFSEKNFARHLRLYTYRKLIEKITRNVILRIYVCEVDGIVVGTATLSKKEGSWWINAVMVDPMYRRQGYGKKLILRACRDAKHLGAKRVFLHVLENNLPAKNLYTFLNFGRFEWVTYFRKAIDHIVEKPFHKCRLVMINEYNYEVTKIVEARSGKASLKQNRKNKLSFSRKWLNVSVRVYTSLFSLLFRSGKVERYLILWDNQPIGVCVNVINPKESYSALVDLNRRFKGLGVEKAIVTEVLNKAFQTGVSQLTIAFKGKSPKLERPFEKLGFTKMCVMEGLFKDL